MRRARLLALLALLSPLGAAARMKIDRYEQAALPQMHLWVSLLHDTRPVQLGVIRAFSVYINGETVGAVTAETAAERGAPMAIAAVMDARFDERWRQTRMGLKEALALSTKGSIAFGIATHEGLSRLPEEKWSKKPMELSASFREVDASGQDPRLYRGLRRALLEFPLRDGLTWESADGPVPQLDPKAPPFPVDRVLYVVGDGRMGVEIGGASASERLRDLVYIARRRGVRIMTIGITEEETGGLWLLRVLARKTGGTYRRAPRPNDLPAVFKEAATELAGRFILTFEDDDARRGDIASFSAKAALTDGSREASREFTAQVGNELTFIERGMDKVNDYWEGLKWWIRWLIIGGVIFIIALLIGLKIFFSVRKARKAAAEAEAARRAVLAKRRPCPVCGEMMMPDWKRCLFCDRAAAQVRPMKFRLVGRSGGYEGRALRFDLEVMMIGAAPDCAVRVVDRGVASKHCGLREHGPDQYVLTDFNTDTGTWVNDTRISQTLLEEGDVIRVGATEFVFGLEA
ncbi:FHA domain-containing protein [Myxococcota bacterium]|nr:FHA domain-containing protein [Myxococcota bacterium]MBU1433039.1 FHA domain-containing protein [Myxococcota bacterium]MBU1899926.1 FHA domain-containing protein [Myxococcota bacterium]